MQHKMSLNETSMQLSIITYRDIIVKNKEDAMDLIQALGTLGGITDRDEMIKACKIISDEDLRSALVLVALSFNNDAKANDDHKLYSRSLITSTFFL